MEYIFLLIWIGAMALIAKGVKLKKTVTVNGVEVERYYWLFAFVVFLPIILIAGNRPDYIGDTYNYKFSYIAVPERFSELGEYYESIIKDKGFYILSALVKTIFHVDYRVWFIILAFIQGISVLSIFRLYSEYYIFSIFLFVASCDYTWMMNGIRQFTAATIIFAATALIIRKKYFPTILVIVFASLFHQTALIMIPMIFLVTGKAWNKKTALVILAVLLAILFIGSFTSLLDSALGDTQYKNVVSNYKSWNDDGTNPLRVAVYSVPAIISFVGRKKIRESNNSIINICTNMSIISAGLYLISMVTSGIFLGRLPIYCSLFSYILLPWEINNIIHEKYRTISYVLMILFYLVFYYYQMHITWQMF